MPSTLEMRGLRLPAPADGRFFCTVSLPEYRESVHLHAHQEQNAIPPIARLGSEGYVAGTPHEMPDAAAIEVRGLTTCRRSVPFL